MCKMLTLQVSSLAQTVSELQREILLLKGTVRPVSEPAYSEPFVVMPERFNGSRASFQCFKVDCEILFALKPRTYASDFIKVRAAINLLSGWIKTWAHQMLLAQNPVLDSWVSFLTALDSQCKTSRKPSTPRSGFRESKIPRDREYQHHTSMLPSCEPVHRETPEVSHVPADSEEPMEIGLIKTKLTPDERDRRRGRGLCFYCGERGHFISLCPTRPPRPRALHLGAVQLYPVSNTPLSVNCQHCCHTSSCSSMAKGTQTTVIETTNVLQVPDNVTSVTLLSKAPEEATLSPKDAVLISTNTTSSLLEEDIPPDCTYASDGTVVCKKDLRLFEEALRARRSTPAEENVHARRASLKGGYCHDSSHTLQTARRGHPTGAFQRY